MSHLFNGRKCQYFELFLICLYTAMLDSSIYSVVDSVIKIFVVLQFHRWFLSYRYIFQVYNIGNSHNRI